ncbi:MAG TPA: ferritin family protein [Bacilli bacterium]
MPNPYTYHYGMNAGADANLVQDIAKAINGQYNAISCYGELAKMAPDDRERAQILEIREDEVRHYQIFSRIYMTLTGRQHAPQITEACPKQYSAGLEWALKDEQKTVDFYHEIADKAHDPRIREPFRRAAADEQNHAVWFLYFFTKQRMA